MGSTSAPVVQQQPAFSRVAAYAGLIVTTSLLLHLALAHEANATVIRVLAVVQAVLALFLAWPWTAPRLAPLACCLVLPASLLLPRSGMVTALLVSHTSLYAGLAWLFGQSLRHGREPLVTAMARELEPVLTEEMRLYTREVTWLWTLYGPAQIILSLLLLTLAPLPLWSGFVNLVDLPLLGATFLMEHIYRRRRLRGTSSASFWSMLALAGRRWRPEPQR